MTKYIETYPKTYYKLFECLKQDIHSRDDLLKWLHTPWKAQNMTGKDSRANKLEACFRLFSIFGLHPFQSKYQLCLGNFNNGETRPCKDSDIEKLLSTCIKDTGDKSDETFENDTEILTITCKDWKKNLVGKFDIAELQRSGKKYGKTHYIGFCVKSRDQLYQTMVNSRNTSQDDSEVIRKAFTNDLVFDYEYLADLYPFLPDNLPSNIIKTFIPYFHQDLCFYKIQQQLRVTNSVILNALPRSGKTQIIGLCIQRLKTIVPEDKSQNVLLITLRPTENFSAYKDFLNTYLHDYNTVFLNNLKGKHPNTKEKTIFVCSKQFLQTKTCNIRKIDWLEKKKFTMVFIDEPHDGGSTDLASKVYNTYCKDTKTVFVTATCSKPAMKYNISKDNIITWDLQDVKLCRTLTITDKEALKKKHGSEYIEKCFSKFSDTVIRKTYNKYPEMILTTCNFYPDIKEKIIQTNSGWSINSLLALDKNNNFLMCEQVIKLMQSIFGKEDRDSCISEVDKKCSLYKWKELMKEHSSRIDNNEPLVMLLFIDTSKVTALGSALKTLLETHILPLEGNVYNYEVIVLNQVENKNANSLERIEKARARCKNRRQQGVIVITGRMCSAAASIPKCDITMLMHDGHSWDNYFQQVFRPLTPDEGKTCGIICDFNNRRSLNFIAILSENIYGKSDTESIHKILDQNIVKIRHSHWYDPESKVFQQKERHNYEIAQIIHQNWLQDVGATRMIIQTLSTQTIISRKSVQEYNTYFNHLKCKNNQKTNVVFLEDIPEELQGEDRDIDDGISYTSKNSSNSSGEKQSEENEKITVNMFQEVFQYIVVLLVIMTIDNSVSDFVTMCTEVQQNNNKKSITINLLRSIWGNKIPDNILERMKQTYINELCNNHALYDNIRYLKERFNAVRQNPRKLYELIEEFLIPHEVERRNNAEISTPPQLRNDMLDKLPKALWTKKVTVFEPCCGKGGFLIDIVDRFMSGLVSRIPSEKKRLKFILEKLLYFADINPLNIYLCETILNPHGKYKLNYYIGDTLEFDIEEIWGKKNFTAVIGNPPYSTDPGKQNTKPLYNLFTEAFIDKCQFLLYVIPSRWFSGGKGLDRFRNMMISRKDIRYIVHTDNAKEWFPNVEIKGGVSYFLKDSSYHGVCRFNNKKTDLSKYDIVIKPRYAKIIDKLKDYPKITDIYMTRGYYGVETNDKRLCDIGNIPVWVSSLKCKSRKKYLNTYDYKDKATWKVISARASGKGGDGFSFMSVSSPDEVYTNSYIGFKAKTREEAESIMSYLECKLPNYMLSIRKISQDINTDTCKWIPTVPFDRIWTDKSVMDYFGLCEDDL